MEKKFSEKLRDGKFVITCEIGPPKGTNLKFLQEAEILRDKVDAFNVTDLQSSVMRLGSLATCHLLVEKGLEPIFQITCRDRNRLALQSDLISAYVLGVRNVLCLTGDYITLGDHPEAKPVFDLDSVNLICMLKMVNARNNISGDPEDYFIGSAVSPFKSTKGESYAQYAKMSKKKLKKLHSTGTEERIAKSIILKKKGGEI